MKVVIKIQSISDIITNSSSEVFCRITSDTQLEAITELLRPLFSGYDSEMYPTMYTKNDLEEDVIELWLPYRYEGVINFYRIGLITILNQYFEGKYKIDWEV